MRESTHALIRTLMSDRNWSYQTLLDRMPGNRRDNEAALEAIATERYPLEPCTARRLARAFDTEARTWLVADRAFHATAQMLTLLPARRVVDTRRAA